jgi:hypothetical protein
MEALGSILLYAVFSLLAMVGAYLALASTRGRKAGLWGALATGLFFLGLYWGLAAIWRLAGAPVP